MGAQGETSIDFDFIVIGSGFGGSVSAHRLTGKGYRVGVMEAGRRCKAEDFPKSNWDTRRWVWMPALKLFGFYSMRMFRHVVVASGNAVGGGSITYANALLRPSDKVWDEGSWDKRPSHERTRELKWMVALLTCSRKLQHCHGDRHGRMASEDSMGPTGVK